MSSHVLIQTAFLGDLLLSIPLMKKIKELWPEHSLVLVCRKGIGDFFIKTGLVDTVLEIKKGDAESYAYAQEQLRNIKIDKVFSPHESLRTAFFVRQIKAKEKVAFYKFWNFFFYQSRVKKDYALPDAVRQLSLLRNYDEKLRQQIETYRENPYVTNEQGLLPPAPSWASMSLKNFYQSSGNRVNTLMQKLGLKESELKTAVALFPGSVWPTKRWTERGFVHVGQRLTNAGVPVLIMGGPGEEALCAKVTTLIPGAKDLCAQTSVFESALILSRVSAVVGNDSASMHLAATCETPSVVAFGPTVLKFGYRPWQDHVYVVERKDMSCRPCGKHGHKKCPLGTHACMKEIKGTEVLEKLEFALR